MLILIIGHFAAPAGMYVLEKRSFTHSMALWWTAMRVITANEYPSTPEGRAISLCLGIPSGYVTATFAVLYWS